LEILLPSQQPSSYTDLLRISLKNCRMDRRKDYLLPHHSRINRLLQVKYLCSSQMLHNQFKARLPLNLKLIKHPRPLLERSRR
jgi:hypothetical protein